MGGMEIAIVISIIAIAVVAVVGIAILAIMVMQSVGGCYEFGLMFFDCESGEGEER